MENIKKNPLSLQLNADDFLPASNEEKQSLVIMRESVNFWKDGLRRLKKNKIAMVSFVFIIAIAIFAYLLPAVWPYSYSEQVKGSNNLAPFEYSASEQARIDAGEKVFPHIMGTDRMGRDFAVRIMMGTRVSLSVGLIASVLVLIIGATYGAVSAFAGGWVDNIMMRITDVLYTIPDILLAPMIEEIFTDLAPLAEKRSITLEAEGDAALTGSDALIYRLLFNLTENAVKYNRPGGSVRVELAQGQEKCIIHVSDTGCGIPEEYQQSIFHPFFRVDKSRSREYGGAGLGLSLVWEIADLHGGSVWVEKSSDKGTTIVVELPAGTESNPSGADIT